METNPSGGKVPSLLDRTRCEPFRLLVAAREVALFLYKKVDTCPFTNIIEGKAVKPYLSQFHSLVGMKGTPITRRQVQLTDHFLPGEESFL